MNDDLIVTAEDTRIIVRVLLKAMDVSPDLLVRNVELHGLGGIASSKMDQAMKLCGRGRRCRVVATLEALSATIGDRTISTAQQFLAEDRNAAKIATLATKKFPAIRRAWYGASGAWAI